MNVGVSSSPSAWALFRLTARSNFVGSSTGKSAGFAPSRILCTYPAGSTPEQVGKVRPVADESAGHHALLRLKHRRQSVLRQKFDDAADVKLVKRIIAHQDGIGPLANYRSKGGLEVNDSADFDCAMPAAEAAIFVSSRATTLEALSKLAR
jgi:hypothetical protein